MKIMLQGQDYTPALDSARPLTIERKLNKPSVCEFALMLPLDGPLPIPQRMQYLQVCGDSGAVYFSGYVTDAPLPEYAGLTTEGPCWRRAVRAISDEMLLDQALAQPANASAALSAGAMMTNLVAHTGSEAISRAELTLATPVGAFESESGAAFSKSAGQLASQARAAYRVVNGALALNAIPGAVHSLDESNGTLTSANLVLASRAKRALANDITVCGEHEPAAYVTEYFVGDGATTQFYLSAEPYFPPASTATLINELFDGPNVDARRWGNPTGSTYFTLGAGGLRMNGGNGIDGATTLAWIDPVNMGGTLLLEATGIALALASTGILAGFFAGFPNASDCVAGFRATAQQVTGEVSLQPIVLGCASGAAFAVSSANQYTLRLRVHCPEVQRTLAAYRASGDNGPVVFGGQSIPAPARMHFEIQEFVNGVAGMPVTLYDGPIANLPAACFLLAASSLNLHGSMRALHLTSLGTGWVVSTPTDGGAFTRRIGSVAESAECQLERSGKLVFYTGSVPQLGEKIAVSYRATSRAVGRAVNTASQQSLAGSASSESAWIGSVTNPRARSSADCRNAAAALAGTAEENSAAWSGTYRTTNFELRDDVWPGDALAFDAPSCDLNTQMIVRSVKLTYRNSIPDLLEYEMHFANDWAEDLAITTSAAVPSDAWLPAPVSPTFAANLNGLTVSAIDGSTVMVNTGATPPAGGGFEVRRRDHAFLPGEDCDLVLRGTQPNLSFPRASANERFYVRVYDGASPPNYSEFSAALFVNIPVDFER